MLFTPRSLPSSSTAIFILFSVAFVAAPSSDEFCSTIPRPLSCDCSNTPDGYELRCSAFTMQVKPKAVVHIQCNTNVFRDFSVLNGTHVGQMETLILRLCPLHSVTLSQLMKKIGASNVSNVQLTYTGVNRNASTTVMRELFHGLSNVTSLTLHTSGTTELMDDVFTGMPNLTFIDLESDNLVLPKNIFCSVKKLKALRLGSNNLTYLEPEIFHNLINLRLLVLRGIMFKLSRSVFSKMDDLELIDSAKLTSLQTHNLEFLEIDSTKMHSLPSDVFQDLTELKYINLYENEFESLPQDLFVNNQNLRAVSIVDNRRTLSTLPPGLLRNLTMLTEVTLRSCNMSTLPEDLLWGSQVIQSIALSRNAFTTLPELLFKDCDLLDELDLSYNKITALPIQLFSALTKLKILMINSNQLSIIPNQLFPYLSNLEVLDLKDNRLTHIELQAFEKLSSLRTVNMTNNMLTLEDASDDLNMDLSPLKFCFMLENIQLANNSVIRIFSDWKNFNNLETLNLAYNKITEIPYVLLRFVSKKDVSVNVSYNNISEIYFIHYEMNFIGILDFFRLITNQCALTWVKKNGKFVYRYIFTEGNLIKCDFKAYSLFLHPDGDREIIKIVMETKSENLYCGKPEECREKRFDRSFFSIKFVSCLLKKRQFLNCPEQCSCPLMISDRALLVDCSQRNLTSMITPEDNLSRSVFSQTHNLEFLEIDSTKMHSLPSDVFQDLTELKYINLYENEFQSLPQDLFVNNKNLREVSIVDNRRTLSTLPPGLLRNITVLYQVTLRSCNMSTMPENLLWGSKVIQSIALNRNAFTTLPELLFKDCVLLYNLDLSYNKITALPIQLFSALTNLETLMINSNRLSIIPNKLFSSLRNLRILELKDNRLRHIKPQAFIGLKNLRTLDMSNNLLTFSEKLNTRTVSPLIPCVNLEDLQLANNSVTKIFIDWRQFISLETLNLALNKITQIKAEDLYFNGAKNIFVNLTYNNISDIDIFENGRFYKYVSETAVYNMPVIHYFIEGNAINCACRVYRFLQCKGEDVTAEIKLTTKTNTSSSQCAKEFEEYTKQMFRKIPTKPFTCLRKTEYRSNCPEQCSCLLFPETKTMVVECFQTNLTSTPSRENVLHNLSRHVFSKLHTLESLDIKWNRMTSLPPDLFVDLKYLQKLSIYASRFKSLPQDLFLNNKDLEMIIENNGVELKSVAFRLLAGLTKLKKVELNSCNISNLPKDLIWGSTSINTISLRNNALITLPEELFVDSSELMTLDISFNRITDLPYNLFSETRNLKTLKINNNQLSSAGNYLIYLNKLEILDLKCNSLTHINYNAFGSLYSLKLVDMSNNMLTSENLRPMYTHRFPNLEDLQLANNSLTKIFGQWRNMENLQTLNLAHNKISSLQIEDLYFFTRKNIFVNVTYNDISEIDIFTENITHWYVPVSSLFKVPERQFFLEGNPIKCDCESYFFSQTKSYFTDTVYVTFSMGSKPHKLVCVKPDGYTYRTEDLYINISIKYFTCLYKKGYNLNCPEPCSCHFRTSDKALRVDCQQRNLTSMPAALPDIMFSKYTELDLSRNRIKSVKCLSGQGYDKVTKFILSDNMINEIDLTTFFPKLQSLELDGNNITQFNKSSIEFLMNSTFLSQLSLHKNPWRCDCTTKNFINVIQSFYHLGKIKTIDNFTCKNGKEILKISDTELCPVESKIIINENYTNTVLGLLFGLLGVLIGCLLAFYYKFKIAIKIWLYAHRCCLWCVNEDELDQDKLYDAFVSYAHQDEEFVLDHLVPRLEDEQYKLCLHQRDWIPGEFIQDQIIRSVEASRRTLIILSKAFLESVWGIMEFRVAHEQALRDRRVRVILILYGDIGPTDKLNSELRTYIRMNTYVEWDDKWFWEKIRYAMPRSSKLRTAIPLQERT